MSAGVIRPTKSYLRPDKDWRKFVIGRKGTGGGGGTDPGSPNNFWKVDSWTTTLAPSVGSVSWNVTGTPSSVSGIINNGAGCDATDYFNSSDALFTFGDTDFTWVLWAKLASTSAVIVDNKQTDPPQGYRIQADTTNGPAFYATGPGGSNTVFWGQAMSSGVWSLIVAAHDSVNNLLKVSLNGGAFATLAHSFGTGTPGFPTTLGNRNFIGNVSVDEVGIWVGKVFTSAEALFLWNNGNGRTY